MNQESQSKHAFEAKKTHTSSHGKRLLVIIRQHTFGRFSDQDKKPETDLSRAKKDQKGSLLLVVLAFVPYVLTITFIVSFFWDFNGVSATFWGHIYYFEGLLRILSVGGLIGFLTNWIAITMLFKPVKKHPLLGQGMIPANKDRIAFRLAQTIAKDIINPETIKRTIHQSNLVSNYRHQSSIYLKEMINDPRFRKELKRWILQYVQTMVDDPELRTAIAQKIISQMEHSMKERSFEQLAIKAYTYLTGSKMQEIVEESLLSLPASVESEFGRFDNLLDDVPYQLETKGEAIEEWITSILYKLVNQLNVHKLVEEKLNQYDEQQLSNLIANATSEQLRFIKYLGGILGIVGGFVIWAPVASLISLVIIAGLIVAADWALLRTSSN